MDNYCPHGGRVVEIFKKYPPGSWMVPNFQNYGFGLTKTQRIDDGNFEDGFLWVNQKSKQIYIKELELN